MVLKKEGREEGRKEQGRVNKYEEGKEENVNK